ncbi:MAG: metallopeptidase TldD-related protein [Acidobacteriota bacterium]
MVDDRLRDVLETLLDSGFGEVEVFHKTGRSRLHRWSSAEGEVSSLRREEGWAVRAGDRRRSFFYAAAGAPSADVAWPDADGQGLRLPSPRPIAPWTPPADLEATLVGETEARALFDAVDRELGDELPGARLVRGWLEDGSSRQEIVSSREIAAGARHRAASLVLEARGPRRGRGGRMLATVERDARRFSPRTLARRMVDRLLVAERGQAPRRDRGEMLLAPELMAGLLAALRPLWIGTRAAERAAALADRSGRLGSRAFSLLDDGRLRGGLLAAPCDGEGLPTREVVLVDDGVFRQPLIRWPEASARQRGTGCSRRASWRDLPALGPSHLYLRPEPGHAVGEMLAEISRGYYLLALDGAPHLDTAGERFSAPVSGFALDSGRATGAVAGCWLCGSVAALLHGVVAVARDLTFTPLAGGMVGAPTTLVRGLELRDRP